MTYRSKIIGGGGGGGGAAPSHLFLLFCKIVYYIATHTALPSRNLIGSSSGRIAP